MSKEGVEENRSKGQERPNKTGKIINKAENRCTIYSDDFFDNHISIRNKFTNKNLKVRKEH